MTIFIRILEESMVCKKRQIDDSIGKNKHHLIVASNILIIEKIKEDYGGIVRTIFIYPKTNAKKINEIFIERACSQEIVELISNYSEN